MNALEMNCLADTLQMNLTFKDGRITGASKIGSSQLISAMKLDLETVSSACIAVGGLGVIVKAQGSLGFFVGCSGQSTSSMMTFILVLDLSQMPNNGVGYLEALVDSKKNQVLSSMCLAMRSYQKAAFKRFGNQAWQPLDM